ncbi:Flp family type IVb pilin [Hyphobacterium marinum]|uniref:Flp family type IVb pilin n=1 Tax=Hyphobacterium marinum TaxID=3116574 RepID=UPI0035A0867D
MGASGETQGLSHARGRHSAGHRTARPNVSLGGFLADQSGATSIEYSVIAVLISIGAIGALMLIGPQVLAMFNDAGGAF